MKFFRSEEHWDLEGYIEHLKTLAPYLNEETYQFFKNDSFHDAHIFSVKLINHFDPDADRTDPTSVEMHLRHSEGDEYKLTWKGVTKFQFDYDITRNTYANSNVIAFEGMRGIDDWGYDEIIPLEQKFLSHEIVLASQTKIIIHCRDIVLNKI